MKFKICIPTHNAADYLDLCLYSLKKYAVWNHEYLIILDDCRDNTKDICKKYDAEYMEVNHHSPYLSRNEILKVFDANDDFLFFMTADDMFASPDWDKNIYSHFAKNNDVVWASQLTDYLLTNTFALEKEQDPDLTIEEYAAWWGERGVNMDFGECGRTAQTFNEEIFLAKYNKLKSDEEYYNSERDGARDVLCNTNFLIHNHFWYEVGGWPPAVKSENSRWGNSDVLFQRKVIELGGRNIVPTNVLFFHFGGLTIGREK